VSPGRPAAHRPLPRDAIEVDVDAVCDGESVYVGAVMQHVEEAGVHSGDSACVIPSISLGEGTLEQVRRQTRQLALALGVKGLINVQFAYQNYQLYVLEVNPRASRTVPFVSKATGVPLAKVATEVVLGRGSPPWTCPEPVPEYVSVKEVVLPFTRFPGADSRLGPEMKSTGEVMGIADVGLAVAQAFTMLGFSLLATPGTARFLAHHAIEAEVVNKVGEGPRDTRERIVAGEVQLVINTPRGGRARSDGRLIRHASRLMGVPCVTTIQGGLAVARALRAGDEATLEPRSLQDWHAPLTATGARQAAGAP
jgi:carbamoyl-phosphate synthase large subunit